MSGLLSVRRTSSDELPPGTLCTVSGPQWLAATVAAPDIAFTSCDMLVCGTVLVAYKTSLGAANFVYRSTDAGESWTKIATAFSIDDIRIGFYLGGTITLVKGSSAASRTTFHSTDQGLTWTTNTTAMLTSGFHYGIATDGVLTIAGLRWASTQSERSTDGGLTWSAGAAVPSRNWNGAAYLNGKYFCAARNNNEVYYSTDAGLTWSLRSTLPNIPTAVVGYTSMSALGTALFAFSTTVAGADLQHYALSLDEGLTWNSYTYPIASKPPNPIVWSGQNCYVSKHRSPSSVTDIGIMLSVDLINWYAPVEDTLLNISGAMPLVDIGGRLAGGNMATLASNNKAVYGFCPGTTPILVQAGAGALSLPSLTLTAGNLSGTLTANSGISELVGDPMTLRAGELNAGNTQVVALTGRSLRLTRGNLAAYGFLVPASGNNVYSRFAVQPAGGGRARTKVEFYPDGRVRLTLGDNSPEFIDNWASPEDANYLGNFELRLEVGGTFMPLIATVPRPAAGVLNAVKYLETDRGYTDGAEAHIFCSVTFYCPSIDPLYFFRYELRIHNYVAEFGA